VCSSDLTAEQNLFVWGPALDEDFLHFLVYRTLVFDAAPTGLSEPLALVIAPTWADPIGVGENAWNYRYWVGAVDHSGNSSAIVGLTGAVADVPGIARTTALHRAVPNPFNPQTSIAFELATEADVNLVVYDVAGRVVRTLISTQLMTSGRHEVVWNGRDGRGQNVAAGLYFYRLDAGATALTRRMTLVK